MGGRGQLAPFPVATFQPLTTLAAKRTNSKRYITVCVNSPTMVIFYNFPIFAANDVNDRLIAPGNGLGCP